MNAEEDLDELTFDTLRLIQKMKQGWLGMRQKKESIEKKKLTSSEKNGDYCYGGDDELNSVKSISGGYDAGDELNHIELELDGVKSINENLHILPKLEDDFAEAYDDMHAFFLDNFDDFFQDFSLFKDQEKDRLYNVTLENLPGKPALKIGIRDADAADAADVGDMSSSLSSKSRRDLKTGGSAPLSNLSNFTQSSPQSDISHEAISFSEQQQKDRVFATDTVQSVLKDLQQDAEACAEQNVRERFRTKLEEMVVQKNEEGEGSFSSNEKDSSSKQEQNNFPNLLENGPSEKFLNWMKDARLRQKAMPNTTNCPEGVKAVKGTLLRIKGFSDFDLKNNPEIDATLGALDANARVQILMQENMQENRDYFVKLMRFRRKMLGSSKEKVVRRKEEKIVVEKEIIEEEKIEEVEKEIPQRQSSLSEAESSHESHNEPQPLPEKNYIIAHHGDQLLEQACYRARYEIWQDHVFGVQDRREENGTGKLLGNGSPSRELASDISEEDSDSFAIGIHPEFGSIPSVVLPEDLENGIVNDGNTEIPDIVIAIPHTDTRNTLPDNWQDGQQFLQDNTFQQEKGPFLKKWQVSFFNDFTENFCFFTQDCFTEDCTIISFLSKNLLIFFFLILLLVVAHPDPAWQRGVRNLTGWSLRNGSDESASNSITLTFEEDESNSWDFLFPEEEGEEEGNGPSPRDNIFFDNSDEKGPTSEAEQPENIEKEDGLLLIGGENESNLLKNSSSSTSSSSEPSSNFIFRFLTSSFLLLILGVLLAQFFDITKVFMLTSIENPDTRNSSFHECCSAFCFQFFSFQRNCCFKCLTIAICIVIPWFLAMWMVYERLETAGFFEQRIEFKGTNFKNADLLNFHQESQDLLLNNLSSRTHLRKTNDILRAFLLQQSLKLKKLEECNNVDYSQYKYSYNRITKNVTDFFKKTFTVEKIFGRVVSSEMRKTLDEVKEVERVGEIEDCVGGEENAAENNPITNAFFLYGMKQDELKSFRLLTLLSPEKMFHHEVGLAVLKKMEILIGEDGEFENDNEEDNTPFDDVIEKEICEIEEFYMKKQDDGNQDDENQDENQKDSVVKQPTVALNITDLVILENTRRIQLAEYLLTNYPQKIDLIWKSLHSSIKSDDRFLEIIEKSLFFYSEIIVGQEIFSIPRSFLVGDHRLPIGRIQFPANFFSNSKRKREDLRMGVSDERVKLFEKLEKQSQSESLTDFAKKNFSHFPSTPAQKWWRRFYFSKNFTISSISGRNSFDSTHNFVNKKLDRFAKHRNRVGNCTNNLPAQHLSDVVVRILCAYLERTVLDFASSQKKSVFKNEKANTVNLLKSFLNSCEFRRGYVEKNDSEKITPKVWELLEDLKLFYFDDRVKDPEIDKNSDSEKSEKSEKWEKKIKVGFEKKSIDELKRILAENRSRSKSEDSNQSDDQSTNSSEVFIGKRIFFHDKKRDRDDTEVSGIFHIKKNSQDAQDSQGSQDSQDAQGSQDSQVSQDSQDSQALVLQGDNSFLHSKVWPLLATGRFHSSLVPVEFTQINGFRQGDYTSRLIKGKWMGIGLGFEKAELGGEWEGTFTNDRSNELHGNNCTKKVLPIGDKRQFPKAKKLTDCFFSECSIQQGAFDDGIFSEGMLFSPMQRQFQNLLNANFLKFGHALNKISGSSSTEEEEGSEGSQNSQNQDFLDLVHLLTFQHIEYGTYQSKNGELHGSNCFRQKADFPCLAFGTFKNGDLIHGRWADNDHQQSYDGSFDDHINMHGDNCCVSVKTGMIRFGEFRNGRFVAGTKLLPHRKGRKGNSETIFHGFSICEHNAPVGNNGFCSKKNGSPFFSVGQFGTLVEGWSGNLINGTWIDGDGNLFK